MSSNHTRCRYKSIVIGDIKITFDTKELKSCVTPCIETSKTQPTWRRKVPNSNSLQTIMKHLHFIFCAARIAKCIQFWRRSESKTDSWGRFGLWKKVIIDFYFFMSSSSSCEARRGELVCVFDENKFASSNLQLYVITAEKDFGSHQVSFEQASAERQEKL